MAISSDSLGVCPWSIEIGLTRVRFKLKSMNKSVVWMSRWDYEKCGFECFDHSITEEMYACLLLYDESKCYIDYELGNSVSIFENMRLVGTENIDYEQDIDGNNQKAFLSGEEYQIQGFFRNRLVKITSEGEYQVYKGFPLRAIVLSAKSIFFLTLAWILCELCKCRIERL